MDFELSNNDFEKAISDGIFDKFNNVCVPPATVCRWFNSLYKNKYKAHLKSSADTAHLYGEEKNNHFPDSLSTDNSKLPLLPEGQKDREPKHIVIKPLDKSIRVNVNVNVNKSGGKTYCGIDTAKLSKEMDLFVSFIETIQVALVSDEDGHEYLIPLSKVSDFEDGISLILSQTDKRLKDGLVK